MTGETGRPQDQGRPHRATRAPAAASVSLLADYHDAMRSELAGLLRELEGKPPAPGLMPDVPADPVRPSLAERGRLWELAIKIAKELAGEIDVATSPAAPAAATPARKSRRGSIDFGGA